MNIIQSIFLGAIQGVTEFLPISSSAHLILARWIFHWPDPGIAFDVILHWGTLIGVLWFFRKTWIRLFKSVLPSRFLRQRKDIAAKNRKMLGILIIATIPGAAAGYLFNDYAENVLRSPMIIAIMMILLGVLLFVGDKKAETKKQSASWRNKETVEIGWGANPFANKREIEWWNGILIGCAQAVAIVPGVSRSGATMTAGLFAGLDRKTAAEFSFLLSAPIIFGAGLKEISDLIKLGRLNLSLILGFLAAAISGFLAIKFLVNYLEKKNFSAFAWYRIIAGAVILAIILRQKF